MTRKDTILIAVIINAGLLAILFATAIIYDTDQSIDYSDYQTIIAEAKTQPAEQKSVVMATAPEAAPVDEVDQVLKHYSEPVVSIDPVPEVIAYQEPVIESRENEETLVVKKDFVEVSVKKGDSLDKIARANGTSVSAIKRANNLSNEKLSIGQVLRIPLRNDAKQAVVASVSVKNIDSASDPVFHVVKSGDSPWKIAKQYGVKYDDILKLNHLDEDKARNLKIGDRIRVK